MVYTISVVDPRRCSRWAPDQNFLNFMHFLGKFSKIVCRYPWRVAGGNPGSTPVFPMSVPMNLPKSAWSSSCVHYPPFLCSHFHFTSLSSCLFLMFPVLSRCLPALLISTVPSPPVSMLSAYFSYTACCALSDLFYYCFMSELISNFSLCQHLRSHF